MPPIPRRLITTSSPSHSHSPTSASTACSELLSRFSSHPVSTRTQLLDANQLHLLSLILGRTPTSSTPPKPGTPIPPGHHLVYFTPSILESELGLDGTDRTVNPLAPFTRRMWAGGELSWEKDEASLLRVGQDVTETTRLISAEPKTLKSGGEMLVVGVEKTFANASGIALTDKRSWVFQREITSDNPAKVAPKLQEKEMPGGTHMRDFCQTDTSLFRFSALTFNAHKIHYEKEWCREVEGHRSAVVHGPLNLINMLDFWRDTARNGGEGVVPKGIAYRAMSPLYVGEAYRILLDKGDQEGDWRVEIWDSFGKQSMKGLILE